MVNEGTRILFLVIYQILKVNKVKKKRWFIPKGLNTIKRHFASRIQQSIKETVNIKNAELRLAQV